MEALTTQEVKPIYQMTRRAAHIFYGLEFGADVVGFLLNDRQFAFTDVESELEAKEIEERVERLAKDIAHQVTHQLENTSHYIREQVSARVKQLLAKTE